MNYSGNSPDVRAASLGLRLKQARLNRDWTQAEVSEKTGLSERSVMNAEKGRVTLRDLISILDVLGVANGIDTLLPEQQISPMQMLKLSGRIRKKGSGKNKRSPDNVIKKAKVDSAW